MIDEDYPRRHDAICEALGKHDVHCPGQLPAHRPVGWGKGGYLKGSTGNVYGLRSLKAIRKYISEQTNGNQDLIDHALKLAGVKSDGEVSYPPAVQARVLVKLLDVVFGKEIRKHVEHSGTVTHEATVARPDVAPMLSRLSIEQLRQYHELRKVMRPPSEGAVDAEVAPASAEEKSDVES